MRRRINGLVKDRRRKKKESCLLARNRNRRLFILINGSTTNVRTWSKPAGSCRRCQLCEWYGRGLYKKSSLYGSIKNAIVTVKKNTKQEEMHTGEDSHRKDFEQYDDLLFLISALLPRTTIGVTQNDIIIIKKIGCNR